MEPEVSLNAGNIADFSYIIPYIRYCNLDLYTNYWFLKKRVIQDYEFIFIANGNGLFILDEQRYSVKPGDLLLIHPGCWHEAKSMTENFSFLCMHFDIYVSASINPIQLTPSHIFEAIPSAPVKYSKANLNLPNCFSCSDIPSLNTLFKKIIHENANRTKGYNTMMKSLFIELLITLLREYSHSAGNRDIPPEIHSALGYMNENIGRKITLTEISKHVHLQSAYFSTLFKKHMGVTFSEYLKHKRLSAAKNLLLNTERKIEDIALSTGFYDIHHFSNIFKKYEGLTPTEYSQLRLR